MDENVVLIDAVLLNALFIKDVTPVKYSNSLKLLISVLAWNVVPTVLLHSVGTAFANSGMRTFTEFRFFTGHKDVLDRTHYNTGVSNGFTKLVLPPQMTGISNYCFNRSTVSFLEVGASFSSIGGQSFRYLNGIGTFILHNPTPPTCGGLSIYYVSSIYVPDESVDTYKAASTWSSHASKIHPISEYDGTLYLS